MEQSKSNSHKQQRVDQSNKIKSMPIALRPREEFERTGVRNASLQTLLAILLRSGARDFNVTDMARELIKHYGDVKGLADASYDELKSLGIKGLGKVKCMELAAAMEIGRRLADNLEPVEYTKSAAHLTSPAEVYKYLLPLARELQQEVFWVIMLNTKKRVIGSPIEATRGLVNTTHVHPREMFAEALRCRAHSVILAHNHPSGDPTPSPEDIAVTRRLIEAAHIVGLEVNDHIVLGVPSPNWPGYISMRTARLLNFELYSGRAAES